MSPENVHGGPTQAPRRGTGHRRNQTAPAAGSVVGMSGTPTWFGPASRPLFGWVHLPADGRARGVAVFCNPVGREAANALPAFQAASDETARAGVRGSALLLRRDRATPPAASTIPGRVPEWVASIGHAVDFARTLSPGPVVLVGMRVGALLATEAVSQGLRVDGLVLWDPSRSGRSFLRLEQTLAGHRLRRAPARRRLRCRSGLHLFVGDGGGPLAPHPAPTRAAGAAHRRARPGRGPGHERARRDFEESGADWVDVEGQAELLDAYPDLLVVPTTTVKTLAERIGQLVGGPSVAVDFTPQTSTVLGAGGSTVREHPEWLGPNALFAMVTEPDSDGQDAAEDAEGGAEGGPTLVFLSAGALDHTGPGRRWVEVTRHFAAGGLRTVRVDLDGLGETDGRPDQRRNVPKPATAIDDVCDIAAALGDPEAAT